MEYVAQFSSAGGQQPEAWAGEREAEGWAGISSADHIGGSGGTWPHIFVTLARFINATHRVKVYPAFANNLARSPVEFAQAALALQEASNGRYEAALGSGWERSEIVGLGFDYPEPAARARRFREAVVIARSLLRDGACEYDGEFYTIN